MSAAEPLPLVVPKYWSCQFWYEVNGCTRHLKVFVAALPELSCADTVTAVVPTGNVEPDAGLLVVATGPSVSSVAEVENVTDAPFVLVAGTVRFAGTLITGAVMSRAYRPSSESCSPLPSPLLAVMFSR